MNKQAQPGLLAIDVGTTRVKLGWFPDAVGCDAEKSSQLPIAAPRLPEPAETFCYGYNHGEGPFVAGLGEFLEQLKGKTPAVIMASVNPDLAQAVEITFNEHGLSVGRVLKVGELPIKIALKEPERVGIDRVLAAVAVNRIRAPELPAIIVSMGTACTVNLISADGVFQGGAILPGLAMAGEALHIGTESLPLISPDAWVLPDRAIGKNTTEAISAGVYWGTAGAIEKLISEQHRSLDAEPQLFLTGGDAELVVEALKSSGHTVRVMPHLVLSGIAIACEVEA